MSHYQPIAGPSSHAHQPPPAHGPPPRFTNGMRPPAGSSNGHPSYSQPVQAILALGAERNLHHAQTLGLVAMNGQQPIPGPRAIQTPSLIKLDKETELCWVAAGELCALFSSQLESS